MAVEHYQGQVRAGANFGPTLPKICGRRGRNLYLINSLQFNSLQWARAIIFRVVRRSRNPAASGGREGGDEMIDNAVSVGAERRRNVPSLRTLFPAASMGGRAAWPPVRLSCGKERCGAAQRGHARDGFSRSTTWGFTRSLFDSVRVFIEATANFDQQPPPFKSRSSKEGRLLILSAAVSVAPPHFAFGGPFVVKFH